MINQFSQYLSWFLDPAQVNNINNSTLSPSCGLENNVVRERPHYAHRYWYNKCAVFYFLKNILIYQKRRMMIKSGFEVDDHVKKWKNISQPVTVETACIDLCISIIKDTFNASEACNYDFYTWKHFCS